MTTFYECRFAPNAATRREVIRNAQVVHDHGTSVYEAFGPHAFEGWGKRPIKVLLDHDTTTVAGSVSVIAPHKDWWIGTFVLDGPHAARAAEWIERCGRLSPGFNPGEMDPDFARPISPGHYATHWHTRGATLNEISILSPGSVAWYQGAMVTRSLESKPARVDSSPRPGVLVRELARRHVGSDLIIDMSDGSQEIHHGSAPTIRRRARRVSSNDEIAELHRRLEWVGSDVDFETVLTNLQHELGYPTGVR